MNPIKLIDKRCLNIRFGDPIFNHDLPFEPDTSHSIHDLSFKLEVTLSKQGPHKFTIRHHWALMNPQDFQLMEFTCTSLFGFQMDREFKTKEEIPIDLLGEFIHAAVSHTRALLALFCAQHKLMDRIAVDLVVTENFLPEVKRQIAEINI